MPAKQPLRSETVHSLKGDIKVPGDKSISHRAIMLASQVIGTTKIGGLLEGEDVLATATAMRSLGVDVEQNGSGNWSVKGVGIGGLYASSNILDLGNSGTSTRLLMGLVSPYPFTTFFTGDDSLRKRPMARVITPLSQMGAKFTASDGGRLPLAVVGTNDMMPISYRLPVASAQVKSAILLAALNTPGKTTVIEPEPTRDHTENMLRYFGYSVESTRSADGANTVSITGQQMLAPKDHEIMVPADPSSAAFPIVAALICKDSDITIANVCLNPLRTGLFATLKEMGAKITFKNERVVAGEKVADIHVGSSQLKGVTVPAERAPSMIDEYPILSVAAAFAKGETIMHGLKELRVKESDRFSAIVDSLTRCGVKVRSDGDTLIVTGSDTPEGGATIETHFDHRIAMSFLVFGMASKKPIIVDDATAIKTSFPNFTKLINGLGANIVAPSAETSSRKRSEPLIIAIDGPAASGKGTLARRLAEHLGLEYLDTGSLYRAVGMKIIYGGGDPSNVETAVQAAKSIDGDDLANPRLRQERIGQAASIVSSFPEVRAELLEFQRRYARSGKGAVLDGRDIGTVVCPDADFKFFITATMYARAKRRHKELEGQGIEVVFDSVLADLRERDERDEKRSIAPMKPADDAFIIDSSSHEANEVFDIVRQVISRKIKA